MDGGCTGRFSRAGSLVRRLGLGTDDESSATGANWGWMSTGAGIFSGDRYTGWVVSTSPARRTVTDDSGIIKQTAIRKS
jgi:hypothetical protein